MKKFDRDRCHQCHLISSKHCRVLIELGLFNGLKMRNFVFLNILSMRFVLDVRNKIGN